MTTEQTRRIQQLASGYFALAAQHRQIAAALGTRSPTSARHKRQAGALDEQAMGWLASTARLETIFGAEVA